MPAKRKKITSVTDNKNYAVTYIPPYEGRPRDLTRKLIKSSGWNVLDGLVTFYGSGPVFVVPERLLVSIELV